MRRAVAARPGRPSHERAQDHRHRQRRDSSPQVEARTLLVHFIRENLGLTGTHIGCDTTSCGACTVSLDGEAVEELHGVRGPGRRRSVETVEGLAAGGKLHPLQEGFWEKHGLQCGFCTPGMLMTARALLEHNPNPSEDEIRHGISGNLCRCTGYNKIVEAIQYAADKLARRREPEHGDATQDRIEHHSPSRRQSANVETTDDVRVTTPARSAAWATG